VNGPRSHEQLIRYQLFSHVISHNPWVHVHAARTARNVVLSPSCVLRSVRVLNTAEQCPELILDTGEKIISQKKKPCLRALLETSVCAQMHLLMDGTIVLFARTIFMDLAVYLMVMILLSPTTTGAFHAFPQQILLYLPQQHHLQLHNNQ
jgi:hypothetical protein